MNLSITKYYKKINDFSELCYNIETKSILTNQEINKLKTILGDVRDFPFLHKVTEVGPRLNFTSSFSTNAVSICKNSGINSITRIEKTLRSTKSLNYDKMTETVYENTLESFNTDNPIDDIFLIPIMENGIQALDEFNIKYSLQFDNHDLNYYYNLFKKDFNRNPTNVEIFDLAQSNSEHSRHWFFNADLVIDVSEC